MNNKVSSSNRPAWLAFWLAIAACLVLAVLIPISLAIDSFGLISALGPVALIALASIILGIVGLTKSPSDPTLPAPGRKAAIAGLTISIAILVLSIAFRVLVFLFFIPWLGA